MSEWHTGWTEGYASARSEAQAEIEKLRAATTPICVGRRIIGILAKEGAWTSETGASVIAADELFQRDPYEEIEKLRAALKDCADDLEAEINARYQIDGKVHPAEQHKYDRDMSTVRAAAAALKDAEE